MDVSKKTGVGNRYVIALALLTACGGNHNGKANTDGGADGAQAVPIIDRALDGNCPGGKPPGTGVAPGNDLHKFTLDDYPDAICNDGTPAIMYVRAASTPAARNSWVIHMQAGGACSDYEVCMQRWCGIGPYEADKMTSRFAPAVANASGIFARGATNAFSPANQVYLYYCSSDSWMGRRSDAVLDDPAGQLPSFRLHFRGHDILEAAARALAAGVRSDDGTETLPSLTNATQVLFSGSSAGSNGLTSSLDWWATKVPNATVVAGMLDAICMPLVEDITDPAIAAKWDAGLRTSWTTVRTQLYSGFSDESCLARHRGDDAYLCGLTTHVQLHHLTTPFFTRQDLVDPVTFNSFVSTSAWLTGTPIAIVDTHPSTLSTCVATTADQSSGREIDSTAIRCRSPRFAPIFLEDLFRPFSQARRKEERLHLREERLRHFGEFTGELRRGPNDLHAGALEILHRPRVLFANRFHDIALIRLRLDEKEHLLIGGERVEIPLREHRRRDAE